MITPTDLNLDHFNRAILSTHFLEKLAAELSWNISLERTVYCLERTTSEFHNVLLALQGNFLENAGNRTFF